MRGELKLEPRLPCGLTPVDESSGDPPIAIGCPRESKPLPAVMSILPCDDRGAASTRIVGMRGEPPPPMEKLAVCLVLRAAFFGLKDSSVWPSLVEYDRTRRTDGGRELSRELACEFRALLAGESGIMGSAGGGSSSPSSSAAPNG